MKKKLLFLIPALLGMFLSACGGGGGSSTPSDPGGGSELGGGSEPGGETKQDFTGVSFESASYVYDGQPHILGEVSGAPENTTITYIITSVISTLLSYILVNKYGMMGATISNVVIMFLLFIGMTVFYIFYYMKQKRKLLQKD